MPPTNQSSRTALITWTVVTSFLFVTATIFAIYYYVASNSASDRADRLDNQYRDIVQPAQLAGPEIATLQAARENQANGYNQSQSLLDIALARADRLSKLMAGPAANNPENTMAQTRAALEASAAKVKNVGMNLPADNLLGALNLLSDAVVQRTTEAANARANADEAVAQQNKLREDADKQIAMLTEQLAERSAANEALQASVNDMTQQKDTQLIDTAAGIELRVTELQAQVDQLTQQNQGLQQVNERRAKELQTVQAKLEEIRPDTNRPMVNQADGRIVRVPTPGVAYIDLGRGDQLIAGMTFEVYDRAEGVPPVGDPANDLNLPRGKGSIEVVRVGATTSECRIVNVTGGHAISEGDIVANLIYDRKTKNRFVVYGQFDLNRTGKPNQQDAEVIKSLITQWGGEVVSDVNVDTDFVVLGAEPVVPTLTDEEKQDPVQAAIVDKAIADFDAYSAISSKAREYRIPILNQNRFLYMIGFFELAKR